jgi:hypothetical protein
MCGLVASVTSNVAILLCALFFWKIKNNLVYFIVVSETPFSQTSISSLLSDIAD